MNIEELQKIKKEVQEYIKARCVSKSEKTVMYGLYGNILSSTITSNITSTSKMVTFSGSLVFIENSEEFMLLINDTKSIIPYMDIKDLSLDTIFNLSVLYDDSVIKSLIYAVHYVKKLDSRNTIFVIPNINQYF